MRLSGTRMLILVVVLAVALIGVIRIVDVLDSGADDDSNDVGSRPLPPEIAQILDDNLVEMTELRVAVDLAAVCMREGGLSIEVTFIPEDEDATWGFDAESLAGPEALSVEEGIRLQEDCTLVWLDQVVEVFTKSAESG